MSIINTQLAGS